MSVAQKMEAAQAIRTQRARSQSFSFRKCIIRATVNGQPRHIGVIYVTSHSSGTIYSVTPGKHGPRCNCMDFIKRCAGSRLECKHIQAAREWNRTQKTQESAEPAGEPAPTPIPVSAPAPVAVKPLPVPPFDVEREARYAAALRDRELLWPAA